MRALTRVQNFLLSLFVDVGLLITCHVCHPYIYLRHQSVTRFCSPIDPSRDLGEEELLVLEFKKGKTRLSSGLSGFFNFGVLSFSVSNAGELGCERRGLEPLTSGA